MSNKEEFDRLYRLIEEAETRGDDDSARRFAASLDSLCERLRSEDLAA